MTDQPWLAHYDEGVPAKIDYKRLTLPEVLDRTVATYGDAPGVVFLNSTLSWRQLAAEVDRMAAAMAGLGVVKGDRVAVQLPNVPQGVIAFYAALRLGATVVMTNPLYTKREVQHQWADSGCKLAVVMDFNWDEILRPNRAELEPENYIVTSIPDYLRFPLNLLAPLKLKRQNPKRWAKVLPEPGVHSWKALMKSAPAKPPEVKVEWDDLAVLQYTGGTTGPSKGAMLTHANLVSNVQQIDTWFTDVHYGKEVMMTALPLFHVFGLNVCMNWGIWAGTKLVLEPNPRDIPNLAKSIAKHKVTLFPAVPALFNNLTLVPGFDRTSAGTIRSCFSGSAPIADDVLQRFEALTGARILEGFGMSETSPVSHVNPLKGLRKIGCVGVPVSDTESRVVDMEAGETEMPMGEKGELVVRGPQVMQGYWEAPEATASTIRDGWMHTGDLATMDEDGFFRIVGRMKDMINCSGMKVYPDELDGVLISHPKILEAATIGIPCEKRGETVKSFIVMNTGETMTEQEVRDFCVENMARYKVPSDIEFMDELPKSSVMKILRRELRDRELKQRGLQS
ncbi:MAG: long-chain acyl-CoA synthetase [Planctomycetota bacterium]|jgi:long-chain acyl-CoA synthetase